jgi:putative FmdB family regulatory protein
MPIYEYACSDCGHEFEVLVRADTVPQCPDCHSQKLEKMLSVFATGVAAGAAIRDQPSPCDTCPGAGRPGACGFN